MNDQISRQKLIEELETEYEGYKNLYCKTFDSEYRGRMDGIDIAIKVVDDQPPADSGPDTNVGTNQWIPCSERLPKKNGRYLVTQKRYPIDDKKHEKLLSIETDYAEFSVSENKWRRANMFEVTAWLDVEPYKGVE